MELKTIGIHSPGEMGSATGKVLAGHGLRVVAALEGRSERTVGLAAEYGIENVGGLRDLVREADLVLSILVPDKAREAAEHVAEAMLAEGQFPVFADCNAIAAQASAEVGALIEAAGAKFIDAGIVGPPPHKPGTTRYYISGAHAPVMAQLKNHGLDVRVVGPDVGQASNLKTSYASLTKGLAALATELLVAARYHGLEEALYEEFKMSQPVLWEWMNKAVLGMPPKAFRFVGEMEEHGRAYASIGLTDKMMEGAADICRFVAETPLGKETPETRDKTRTMPEAIALLADALAARQKA